jgi:LysR family hydrogen peroxide-inducible transcriptional activator
MDLGQLRYFSKIVEHRSFTKAAGDCSVSQPALSQQIGKLEKELGQPLFERQGRSIRLTPAGQLLHVQANKILQLADDAKKQITDDGESGQICISALPTIAPYLVPRLLRILQGQFPEANFIISEDKTDDLLKRCSNGEVDIGIVALPATGKYLTVEPIFEEELMLAVSSANPLSKKTSIVIEDLKHESFVLLRDTHCLVDSIESFCNENQFQPVTTARIEQLTTVQHLVALDHGISFVPKMATAIDLDGKIVYRSISTNQPAREIALCWNPYRYQSRLLTRFIAAIEQLCESSVAPHEYPISNDDILNVDTSPSTAKLKTLNFKHPGGKFKQT